jgi:hypothetical protein
MSSGNWIPAKEQDLVDLLAHWETYLSDPAKIAAFGWDAAKCSDVLAKIGDFLAARAEYEANKTPANRLMKDEKRKILEAAMRAFANAYIRYNDKMTDADKLVVGIAPSSHSHSPKPKPTDHVAFTLSVDAQSHSVRGDFRIMDSERKNKGPYHGVEVRIWVLPLDAAPPVIAEHPGWRSYVDTATPWEHTFTDAADIGKRLYVTMRWENASVGKNIDDDASKGPWSAIQNVVIA